MDSTNRIEGEEILHSSRHHTRSIFVCFCAQQIGILEYITHKKYVFSAQLSDIKWIAHVQCVSFGISSYQYWKLMMHLLQFTIVLNFQSEATTEII